MTIRHIVWDFNGTLVNDRELAFAILCDMSRRWNVPQVDISYYLSTFRHPVSAFYEKIGFPPSHFSEVVGEFHTAYQEGVGTCALHLGAQETLDAMKRRGVDQSILSAAEQVMLDRLVSQFGIARYFSVVHGLSNHHAVSKVEKALAHQKSLALETNEILFVGDTDHDAEVARAMGCPCVLLALGHQSESVLKKCGEIVLPDFQALLEWLIPRTSG